MLTVATGVPVIAVTKCGHRCTCTLTAGVHRIAVATVVPVITVATTGVLALWPQVYTGSLWPQLHQRSLLLHL